MNRGDAKLLAPILIAWSDGKTIQRLGINDTWIDLHPDEAPVKSWPTVYRIKPEPPPVSYIPIDHKDVPPGSVFRIRNWGNSGYWIPAKVTDINVIFPEPRGGTYTYEKLLTEEWDIKRPGEDWTPCHKVKPTA